MALTSKIVIPEKLPYDKANASSIFDYSKGLLDKTLRELYGKDTSPKKARVALDKW